jgi:two-component system CheB/CheR fusion protein
MSPVADRRGTMIAASTIARDISARLEQEAHRELLLHELNHRVKNTLATVQSIMEQTLQNAPSLAAFRDVFAARIQALAKAHNLLTHENWRGVSLRELLLTELAPYGDKGRRNWELEGEDVQIEPVQALSLGMAFHELATNAAKYGALSAPGGRIAINWKADRSSGRRMLHLVWVERGGPAVEKPHRQGFGLRLLQDGLTYAVEAEAKLDFEAGGLRYTMDMPLDLRAEIQG